MPRKKTVKEENSKTPKKTKKATSKQAPDATKKAIIRNETMENILEENYMPYSMSVIVSRSIPQIDGLKPSHRKLLYTMYKMGLLTGSRTKSATIASQTMLLNPHGDASNYETMVRLTDNNETLLAPLVSGQGNFGKHYSTEMEPAASRYCVTGETLIATTEGFKKIGTLFKSEENSEQEIDINVKSLTKINHASKFFNSGKQKVRKIILQNGIDLTGSLNHPIAVLNKKTNKVSWKTLDTIKKNDLVFLDLNYCECFGTNDNLDEAKIIALTLSAETMEIAQKNIDKLIQEEKVEYPNRQSFSWENTLLSGTKEYQKTFIEYFLRNSEPYIIPDKKTKKNRGIIFPVALKSRKYLQLILGSNFGIVSYIYNKGIFIPNNYLCKFKTIFNNLNFSVLKNISTFSKIINRPDFSPVISVKDLPEPQVVYSIKVDSNCHSFSANGIFNHNTEAKLAPIADEFFKGIKKDADNFVPNYDATQTEPLLLPVTFPNILANPNYGIAVGIATRICSFNLKELCDATILRIKHPRKNIQEVMPGPDFSTGGYLLLEPDVIDQVYKTGSGNIKLRAKYRVDKKNRIIEVYEIPYTTTAEAIIAGVSDAYKTGKVKDITAIRDEIDLNGFKIAIDYKREADPDEIMKKLFSCTKLQDSFPCNFNVIIDNNPLSIGVIEILDKWIEWRRRCVEKELSYDLKQKEDLLHLLEGLQKILLDIDKCIRIIRKTESDAEVVPALMKAFKIDKVQAEYVAEIKLRNLNKEYILNKTKNIADLKKEIQDLKKKIATGIDKEIIKELEYVEKKYGEERKTEIIPYENDEIKISNLKENYPSKYIVTKDGYLKKIPVADFKEQNLKFKTGDEASLTINGDENTEVLVFTDAGRVYKLYGENIKNQKPKDFGEMIFTLAKCKPDERIIHTAFMDDKGWILIAFKNGKIIRIPMESFKTLTKKKCFEKGFNTESPAVGIFSTTDTSEIYTITTGDGRKIVFQASKVSPKTTRTATGIMAVRAKKPEITKFSLGGEKNLCVSKLPNSGK